MVSWHENLSWHTIKLSRKGPQISVFILPLLRFSTILFGPVNTFLILFFRKFVHA